MNKNKTKNNTKWGYGIKLAKTTISTPVDEIWDHQHTSDRTVESVCFRAWSDCTSNNCLKPPCFLLNV